MTMTPFTCDSFAEHLADYLERDADVATRAAMDAHASRCTECGALLADLAAIRSDAAALPMLEPSRDLWSGIAERIQTPVFDMASAVGRRPSAVTAQRVRRRWWAHPALLAAGLVGITAGVTHYLTKALGDGAALGQAATAPAIRVIRDTVVVQVPLQVAEVAAEPGETTASPRNDTGSRSAAAPTNARPEAAVASVRQTPAPRLTQFASTADGRRPTVDASYRSGELAALDSLYHREILRLRQIIGERRAQLDSTTVSVLERNMTVIDRAIAECRAALAADPASRFLNQQLNEALETKIELLRTAATMPIGS